MLQRYFGRIAVFKLEYPELHSLHGLVRTEHSLSSRFISIWAQSLLPQILYWRNELQHDCLGRRPHSFAWLDFELDRNAIFQPNQLNSDHVSYVDWRKQSICHVNLVYSFFYSELKFRTKSNLF
jgi:hypothetical protein